MTKTFEQLTAAEKELMVKKALDLKAKEKRYWARQAIMLHKAKAAGIVVTEVEVDKYLAGRK